jgi:hypothetical protein
MAQAEGTGMMVTTKFFFLAFLLYFFPPTVVIDGTANQVKWGSHFWPTPPGDHSVKIFFKYLFMKEAGPAETTVTVPEGGTANVTYKAPWLVFLKGKISTAAS